MQPTLGKLHKCVEFFVKTHYTCGRQLCLDQITLSHVCLARGAIALAIPHGLLAIPPGPLAIPPRLLAIPRGLLAPLPWPLPWSLPWPFLLARGVIGPDQFYVEVIQVVFIQGCRKQTCELNLLEQNLAAEFI